MKFFYKYLSYRILFSIQQYMMLNVIEERYNKNYENLNYDKVNIWLNNSDVKTKKICPKTNKIFAATFYTSLCAFSSYIQKRNMFSINVNQKSWKLVTVVRKRQEYATWIKASFWGNLACPCFVLSILTKTFGECWQTPTARDNFNFVWSDELRFHIKDCHMHDWSQKKPHWAK